MGTARKPPAFELPPPPRKTIDAEGTIVVQGVSKAIRENRAALADLLRVARALRNVADHPSEPGYPQVLQDLRQVMERLVQWSRWLRCGANYLTDRIPAALCRYIHVREDVMQAFFQT